GQGAEEGEDEAARRALGGGALLGEGDGRAALLDELDEAQEVGGGARAAVDLRPEHAVALGRLTQEAGPGRAGGERDGAGLRLVGVLDGVGGGVAAQGRALLGDRAGRGGVEGDAEVEAVSHAAMVLHRVARKVLRGIRWWIRRRPRS